MGYEIDFLQVSDSSRSSDAIALRWGNLHNNSPNNNFIVLIDSGFGYSGEKVADLIERYYGTTTIDLVVSTHPDADHINGLNYILDNCDVRELWMHLPWEHNSDIANKFKDRRVTENSIGERLKEECETAWDLYNQAQKKGIKVNEPFSHQDIETSIHGGKLKILGPSKEFYKELLPSFVLPDFDKPPPKKSIFETATKAITNWLDENWYTDSINNEGKTSAENDSSVILEFIYGDDRFLFTADAGIPALTKASDLVSKEKNLKLIQIPHHGSRRNVGPDILNEIIGLPVDKNYSRNITAVVSCANDHDKKHPNKRVLNAFTRRGCRCFKTSENGFNVNYNSYRTYSSGTPYDFFHKVEAEE